MPKRTEKKATGIVTAVSKYGKFIKVKGVSNWLVLKDNVKKFLNGTLKKGDKIKYSYVLKNKRRNITFLKKLGSASSTKKTSTGKSPEEIERITRGNAINASCSAISALKVKDYETLEKLVFKLANKIEKYIKGIKENGDLIEEDEEEIVEEPEEEIEETEDDIEEEIEDEEEVEDEVEEEDEENEESEDEELW